MSAVLDRTPTPVARRQAGKPILSLEVAFGAGLAVVSALLANPPQLTFEDIARNREPFAE